MPAAPPRCPWIGIDPGARWTGIVVRNGTCLLGWTVIDRQKVDPDSERHTPKTMEAVAEAIGLLADPATCRIAIEDAIAPNPHVTRQDGSSLTNPRGIIETARMVGYLQCAFPGAVVVRPNGHGSNALASYLDGPGGIVTTTGPGLVTAREKTNAIRMRRLATRAPDNPPQCHARSGWDIAGAAAAEARIEQGRLRLAQHRQAHARPATTRRRRIS
jgi:hypothetical protein